MSHERVLLLGYSRALWLNIKRIRSIYSIHNFRIYLLQSRGISLSYSTYLGGNFFEYPYGIAVDDMGHAYVAGLTASSDFPVEGGYQSDPDGYGGLDAFVSKFNDAGDGLIYSTYFGGTDSDVGHGITLDELGNVYLVGETTSSDLPTQNPYQPSIEGSSDAFITKFNSSGDALVYSTYLGSYSLDDAHGIALDDLHQAYVVGRTASSDFPIQGEYQTYQGGSDAFVVKLNSSGNSLIYSTFLGGSDDDYGYGIALDDAGSAYVTGYTRSTDFPTENPFQPNHGGGLEDGFITKMNIAGNGLAYSTYIGGSENDQARAIAVDASGHACVTGITNSTDFTLQNEYQACRVADAFVTKLGLAGDALEFSTCLGGNHYDIGEGIAMDADDNIYVTGTTKSTNFPTIAEYQEDQGGDDVFITMLISNGSEPYFSTYLGGGDDDKGYTITVDASGNTYVAGYTTSFDFPTENAFQPDHAPGITDAFVTKFSVAVYICGDADSSGAVDIDDVVYLIAYIFTGGPEPLPYESGDANCSGGVDIDDVVYLIAYIFSGGNAPCDTDGNGMREC